MEALSQIELIATDALPLRARKPSSATPNGAVGGTAGVTEATPTGRSSARPERQSLTLAAVAATRLSRESLAADELAGDGPQPSCSSGQRSPTAIDGTSAARSNAIDPCAFIALLMHRWEGAIEEGYSRLLDAFDLVDARADGSLPVVEMHRALCALAPHVTPSDSAAICRDALRASRGQGARDAPRRAEQALRFEFAAAAQRRGVLAALHRGLELQLSLIHI